MAISTNNRVGLVYGITGVACVVVMLALSWRHEPRHEPTMAEKMGISGSEPNPILYYHAAERPCCVCCSEEKE